ncbi:MAG: hypothetical protein Unbinned80contig1000_15 [Prokaryotic dsDNA virus sp.]|nr:MAG: hypothetical protein Unbinned80contig1000_15 [Prokaryotic dsDNA virus sp.]|tara:strand:- start:9224 stop:10141 length:918 start_codon:yes stop_codon:yes gene_type:complete
MSEELTSPEPVESADASASVESPEPSGIEAEPNEAVETAADSTETAVEENQSDNEFDVESWDGNIDSLPEHLQGPVRSIQKNLEGGYTKKFQTLADQRKEFEASQTTWNEEREKWENSKEDLIAERDLLKQMMDGGEDPRVAEFTTKYETSQSELAELKAQYEEFQALVEKDIETQANEYAEKFYQEHKDLIDNEETSAILNGLLDQGWDPELSIKLVHQSEESLALANSLREKGTPQEVAVEHALLKHGEKKRAPRPAAKLTAGAESSNNPASSRDYIDTGTNSTDARFAAAQAALNWSRRNNR